MPKPKPDFTTLGAAGDPARRRKTTLYYKSPPLTEHVVNSVYSLYSKGMELISIARTVNGRLDRSSMARGVPYLALCDIYAILQNGINTKVTVLNQKQNPVLLSQRVKHLTHELRISEFATIYRAWRDGELPTRILKDEKTYPGCNVGKQRAIKSLIRRCQLEQTRVETMIEKFSTEIISNMTLQEFETEDGIQPALVVLLADLPQVVNEQLEQLLMEIGSSLDNSSIKVEDQEVIVDEVINEYSDIAVSEAEIKKREIQEREAAILEAQAKKGIVVTEQDRVFKNSSSSLEDERDIFTQVAISNIEADSIDDFIEDAEHREDEEEKQAQQQEVIDDDKKEEKIKDIFS